MGAFDFDPTSAPAAGGGLLNGQLPGLRQEATVVVKAPVGTSLDSIPAPRPPESNGPLSPEEQKTLDACKAGMDNLQNAFWVAGKSLETMRAGELHRDEGVANFAEYVFQNWEVSETVAYRLMDEWRVGDALAKLGYRPREAQVRVLTGVKNQAGDDAAVAVYDSVARTGKRVTAKLLGEVVEKLPPLTSESSPAAIGKLVREALQPPAPDRAESEIQSATAPPAGASADGTGTEAVPDITSLGRNSDSPIGESGSQASNPKGSSSAAADLQQLNAALAVLSSVETKISKPLVRRALEHDPETAQVVLKEIFDSLNRIERTLTVRGAKD
ncbi:hypothetical protein RCO28_34410 [Streptomyces sp. LHD-70]|uniref:hypothetical protein n=1 Tax=Streptomyces sp. LHD-70 TaxID=3072140 RepID=UPI00280F224B|nr:hypothetical protein [Streptomyces sp. LHD-70]MDQ8707526.1 hypothetical protein [Streptomyces sp. LHD-70]